MLQVDVGELNRIEQDDSVIVQLKKLATQYGNQALFADPEPARYFRTFAAQLNLIIEGKQL